MNIPPFDFLKVLPADIGRVGFDGACLLALVRWATAKDDGRYGRVVIDGQVWWKASQSVIAEALGGVSHDAVNRLTSKLQIAGELTVLAATESSDRRKAYQVPDVPLRDSASPSSSDYAESRDLTRNRVTHYADSRNALPIQRKRRSGESAAAETATPPTTPHPSPENSNEQRPANPNLVCPNHPDGDTGVACGGCARVKDEKRRRDEDGARAAQQAREAAYAERMNCKTCEGTNWIPDTEPAQQCHHGNPPPARDDEPDDAAEDDGLTPEQFMALLEVRMGQEL